MNKLLFVFSAPIDTVSGYGARSRDIAKAIISSGKYDFKILPQRWGSTPWGALKKDNPEHKNILDCFLHEPLKIKPDIWCQCTVPNEFQAVGHFNIGITAGIETTLCDRSWIDGTNKMDLTLVSSNHSKNVLINTLYEEVDSITKQVIKTVKVIKPVEVLFEGVDTSIYKKEFEKTEVTDILNTIDENFCFLFVGMWLQGELGEDRKDVGMLIKTFLETFKGKSKKPALVLKINGGNYSILDRNDILNKINKIRSFLGDEDLPKIYLIHGELSDEGINEIYNHEKIKVMVSFTKGEGFGRPLLEFSITGKPIIVSNYSGHLDFLGEYSTLLGGEIKQIAKGAVVPNLLIPESSWFNVNYEEAKKVLQKVHKDYKDFLGSSKKQSYLSRTKFSLEEMQKELIEKLNNIVPEKVELKLPKLIKV